MAADDLTTERVREWRGCAKLDEGRWVKEVITLCDALLEARAKLAEYELDPAEDALAEELLKHAADEWMKGVRAKERRETWAEAARLLNMVIQRGPEKMLGDLIVIAADFERRAQGAGA